MRNSPQSARPSGAWCCWGRCTGCRCAVWRCRALTSLPHLWAEIEIDQDAVAAIRALRQVVVSPAAHAQEHSLEVQLPFLQLALDDFKLLPLAVGDATPAEVAQVLDALWGGDETLIVISSDLSHFLPYATAQAVDSETVQAMLQLQPGLDHQQACGGTPVNGLLLAARQHHLQPQLLGCAIRVTRPATKAGWWATRHWRSPRRQRMDTDSGTD